MKIALDDKSLFGNEAAEDEHEDVFSSYAVDRPEVASCRVPCDHIPRKSWAFFEARAVMLGVLESFERE